MRKILLITFMLSMIKMTSQDMSVVYEDDSFIELKINDQTVEFLILDTQLKNLNDQQEQTIYGHKMKIRKIYTIRDFYSNKIRKLSFWVNKENQIIKLEN